jgi:hypothetical protein
VKTRETVDAMGINTSEFQGPIIPVIYNLIFGIGGLFHRHHARNAKTKTDLCGEFGCVELSKFRSLLATIYGTATDPMQAAITYYSLKNISGGTGAATILPGNTTIVTPPASTP